MNQKVKLKQQNIEGMITGTFGKGGKLKIRFDDEIDVNDPNLINGELEMTQKYTIWKKYLKK